MKKLLSAVMFITCLQGYGQGITLSPNASITVVTCGPTQEELYSAFGHSAFHVYDPTLQVDEIYNYGVFDFDQPNFYLNFARGHLNYKLGVHDYTAFSDYYVRHNRYMHEQVLNLTPTQLNKVYAYLQWNAKPENEYYLYDYFYDNCATKMRDVILQALGDEVSFDGSYIKTNYTIRQLTDLYLKKQPWGDLGIDLCLGLPMDKKAAPIEYMFLPEYVESGFNHASIKHDSLTIPLVVKTIRTYEEIPTKEGSSLPHPLYLFIGFAIIVGIISYRDFNRSKPMLWFDAGLFSIVGLVGILLFLLAFATDHKAAANNMNILWALPTHFVAVFGFIRKPKFLKYYFLGVCLLDIVLLVSWPFLPQMMPYAITPLVASLAIRSFMIYRLI